MSSRSTAIDGCNTDAIDGIGDEKVLVEAKQDTRWWEEEAGGKIASTAPGAGLAGWRCNAARCGAPLHIDCLAGLMGHDRNNCGRCFGRELLRTTGRWVCPNAFYCRRASWRSSPANDLCSSWPKGRNLAQLRAHRYNVWSNTTRHGVFSDAAVAMCDPRTRMSISGHVDGGFNWSAGTCLSKRAA